MNKHILFHGSEETFSTLQHLTDAQVVAIDDIQDVGKQHTTALVVEINDIEQDLIWLGNVQTHLTTASVSQIAICRPDQFDQVVAAGATEVLHYPLNVTELKIRLNTVMQHHSIAGSLDVIAHDINSPLGIIEYSLQLMLEILQDGPDALPVIQQFIENMLIASYRLRLMCMDMLDYFRLENHQLPISKITVDIQQLIRSSIENTEPIGHENHITVAYQPHENPIHAKTDAGLLQRILEAALDTAIKFCQPRSTITISSHVDSDTVVISIQDPGQAIDITYPPDVLFSPAVQSAMREAGKRSAVSLSLPFVGAAIRALDGSVTLDSDAQSTTLRLMFPVG